MISCLQESMHLVVEKEKKMNLLYTEKKLLDDINIEGIMDDFVSRNVRRYF